MITETQLHQTQMANSIRSLQRQILFLLHETKDPLDLPKADPAIAVWDFNTNTLLEHNIQLELLLKRKKEELVGFSCVQLFPDYFLPFANDFYVEMQNNVSKGVTDGVAQVMMIVNSVGEERKVHVFSVPEVAGKGLIVRYMMYLRPYP